MYFLDLVTQTSCYQNLPAVPTCTNAELQCRPRYYYCACAKVQQHRNVRRDSTRPASSQEHVGRGGDRLEETQPYTGEAQ